ncbi:MAG: 16S rRNA (cytosine(967)-C(5))-methyltransferase RsmB [Lachnospiraceae bacterium]|nr:16S rRNA (cytosine(967)-C(5))-methyltransferase RsmB [Lachnospiraceae bacterium]
MKKATAGRRLALDILLGAESEGGKADVLIRNALNRNFDMDDRDRAFVSRLTRGCIEKRIFLDYAADQFASKKTAKMKPVIRNVIRMGIYQMLFMDSVPDATACNEAVLLAEERGFKGLTGFVNGVLRNVSRNRDIKLPDEEDVLNYLSIKYAMPKELCAMFEERFGRKRAERLLAAYDTERPLSVRFILGDEGAECIAVENWKAAAVDAVHNPYLEHMYFLRNVPGVELLQGYDEGLFMVADTSSALAAICAGVKKGDRVIDLCAAPGGKSMILAAAAGCEGRVLAYDVSEDKKTLIEENARRLGMENISAGVHDATVFDKELEVSADVVMADLPCSGMGVMGRKCDIRHNIDTGKISELAALQRRILSNAVRYLKSGGTLLFSTCTVSRQENEDNADWLIKEKGMLPDSLGGFLPASLKEYETEEGRVQLLCGEPAGLPLIDSFFISRFKKP